MIAAPSRQPVAAATDPAPVPHPAAIPSAEAVAHVEALVAERVLWARDLAAFLDHWWPTEEAELRTALATLTGMLERVRQYAVDATLALRHNPGVFLNQEIALHIAPDRLAEQSARLCGAIWVVTRWHTPVYVALDDYPGSAVDVSDQPPPLFQPPLRRAALPALRAVPTGEPALTAPAARPPGRAAGGGRAGLPRGGPARPGRRADRRGARAR